MVCTAADKELLMTNQPPADCILHLGSIRDHHTGLSRATLYYTVRAVTLQPQLCILTCCRGLWEPAIDQSSRNPISYQIYAAQQQMITEPVHGGCGCHSRGAA